MKKVYYNLKHNIALLEEEMLLYYTEEEIQSLMEEGMLDEIEMYL